MGLPRGWRLLLQWWTAHERLVLNGPTDSKAARLDPRRPFRSGNLDVAVSQEPFTVSCFESKRNREPAHELAQGLEVGARINLEVR